MSGVRCSVHAPAHLRPRPAAMPNPGRVTSMAPPPVGSWAAPGTVSDRWYKRQFDQFVWPPFRARHLGAYIGRSEVARTPLYTPQRPYIIEMMHSYTLPI